MKFRKKPVVIEATQWFRNGDHPEDGTGRDPSKTTSDIFQLEGKVVRYFRHPNRGGETPCRHCQLVMNKHGWIDTLEGGHIVCPGDFIITGVNGEVYPCKPDIFAATYDAVEANDIATRIADYEDSIRAVLDEKCAPDERHCLCVPALRAEIEAQHLIVSTVDSGRVKAERERDVAVKACAAMRREIAFVLENHNYPVSPKQRDLLRE